MPSIVSSQSACCMQTPMVTPRRAGVKLLPEFQSNEYRSKSIAAPGPQKP